MIDHRDYSAWQSETSSSLENVTTEMTTLTSTTTTSILTSNTVTHVTISVPPDGLSDGAIAGIVIGTVIGVIGFVLLAFIIYKYRQRFIDILQKDSKQSNNRSVPNKLDKPQPNITYAADHEYLTVNTHSLPENQ